METNKLPVYKKNLIDVNDPSNINKKSQFLLAPELVLNYSDSKINFQTPKFDE